MLIFISGGVRSGKSSLGERLAVSLAGENRKIYLAAARHYDEEITKRIQIHQQNRAGKDFLTIDKSRDIGEVAVAVNGKEILEVEDTVIVDCLGTLLANELFDSPLEMSNAELREKIFADLNLIHKKVSNLLVVSNEVFGDGLVYPESTEGYIQTLAQLHIKLVEASDVAIECVYSGYQCHKGKIRSDCLL